MNEALAKNVIINPDLDTWVTHTQDNDMVHYLDVPSNGEEPYVEFIIDNNTSAPKLAAAAEAAPIKELIAFDYYGFGRFRIKDYIDHIEAPNGCKITYFSDYITTEYAEADTYTVKVFFKDALPAGYLYTDAVKVTANSMVYWDPINIGSYNTDFYCTSKALIRYMILTNRDYMECVSAYVDGNFEDSVSKYYCNDFFEIFFGYAV